MRSKFRQRNTDHTRSEGAVRIRPERFLFLPRLHRPGIPIPFQILLSNHPSSPVLASETARATKYTDAGLINAKGHSGFKAGVKFHQTGLQRKDRKRSGAETPHEVIELDVDKAAVEGFVESAVCVAIAIDERHDPLVFKL